MQIAAKTQGSYEKTFGDEIQSTNRQKIQLNILFVAAFKSTTSKALIN